MSIIDRFRLEGRAVVVAGAASDLGLAFAGALAEAGADVMVAGPHQEHLLAAAEVVRAAGRCAITRRCDLAQPEECRQLAAAAHREFGRVDVLINNADVAAATVSIVDSPPSRRPGPVQACLIACLCTAHAIAELMGPGGSIVNVSGRLAFGPPGAEATDQAAGRNALFGLTRDLAQHWGPRGGVRVNAIAPGFFGPIGVARAEAGQVEALGSRLALGRFGRTEDLVSTMIWLASDAAAYVTGQTIQVDGGVSVR